VRVILLVEYALFGPLKREVSESRLETDFDVVV
jgi:hypothetical protein